MAFKIVAVFALASIVSAGVYHHEQAHHGAAIHGAPVLKYVEHHDDDHSVPQPYDFKYGVHDSHTGDIKDQTESGDGHGNVHGSYSLIDADGFKRTVEYTADPHNGFNAKVHREPLGHAHKVVVVAAPYHSHGDHHSHY